MKAYLNTQIHINKFACFRYMAASLLFCIGLLGAPFHFVDDVSKEAKWNFIASARAQALPGKRSPQWYGVIEIGSKGVKGHVFDLDRVRSNQACKVNPEIYRKCLAPKTILTLDASAVDRAQIEETVRAASDIKRVMFSSSEYRIDSERLYVVGSSGVAKVDHKLDLTNKLNSDLGLSGNHKVDFVSDEEEPQYAFKGIMGMLPAKYQLERQSQAMVVDFGSGNTKGSYKNLERPDKPVESFSIPWGTRKATQYINDNRGDIEFSEYSEKFRQGVLVPLMRREFTNKTYASTRPRIYLVGGIVWAVSNLSQPRSVASFPPMTLNDIESIYARAVSKNGFADLCVNNPDLEINKEIARVCSIFPNEQLIAGLQLLRTFAREMKFDQKSVFFFRDSQYAWPLGYLENKVGG